MNVKQLIEELKEHPEDRIDMKAATNEEGSSLAEALENVNGVIDAFGGEDLCGDEQDGWKAKVWLHTPDEVQDFCKELEDAEGSRLELEVEIGCHRPDWPVGPNEDPPCRYVEITVTSKR